MADSTKLLRVLGVHGGFVDGSGWQPVYDLLQQADGFNVSVVQNPTMPKMMMLAGHAAGHRRGGRSSRRALLRRGSHHRGRADDVAALVYISAFAPQRASR